MEEEDEVWALYGLTASPTFCGSKVVSIEARVPTAKQTGRSQRTHRKNKSRGKKLIRNDVQVLLRTVNRRLHQRVDRYHALAKSPGRPPQQHTFTQYRLPPAKQQNQQPLPPTPSHAPPK
eukprot:5572995-Amphidinium_carterae.1